MSLDAPPHVQPAECQAEDEGAQHQLERMGRAAQYQAQHPDPADLVHERGRAGQERRDREPAGERVLARGARRRCGRVARLRVPSEPRTAAQTTSASAMLRSPAVRIVPGRPTAPISTKPLTSTPIAAPRLLVKYSVASVSPGLLGPAADQTAADQRKGHAQQHRLRQDQKRAQRPFVGLDQQRPRERGNHRGKREIRRRRRRS